MWTEEYQEKLTRYVDLREWLKRHEECEYWYKGKLDEKVEVGRELFDAGILDAMGRLTAFAVEKGLEMIRSAPNDASVAA